MWKILKAQLNYNKLVLIGCGFFSLAVIVPFIVQDWQDIDKSYPALRAALFAMTVIVFFSSFVRNVKEKRDHFFNKLPINVLQLGLIRLFFILLFWFCLMVFVGIAFIIRPSIFNGKILMDLLSQTGFIFSLIGIVFILKDLSYVLIFKKLKILIGVLNFIVILGCYLLFMLFIVSKNAMEISPSLIPLKDGFNQFITSIAGSVVFMLLGMAMCFLSINVFSWRKTFIE
jgi:hypothetical protein